MITFTDKELKNLKELVKEVETENIRQLIKWGVQTRTPFEWMTYLSEEVGEVAEAISKLAYAPSEKHRKELFKEAIQVATLALKIAEINMEE